MSNAPTTFSEQMNFENAFNGYNKGQVEAFIDYIDKAWVSRNKEVTDLRNENAQLKANLQAYSSGESDVKALQEQAAKATEAITRLNTVNQNSIKTIQEKDAEIAALKEKLAAKETARGVFLMPLLMRAFSVRRLSLRRWRLRSSKIAPMSI